MSRPWVGSDGVGQVALLAVDPRDLLPAGHLVWDVLARVGELDLSVFRAAYRADGRGHPPYDPAMMLALILYCRSKKLSSSRQIAAACHDDLGARVITGNRFPDRSAVDRFLKTHAVALRQLLVQTLRLGAGQGLVDVAVVAGDGTKILAYAAMSATVEESQLHAQIAGLQEQIAATQALWARQVTSDGIHESDRNRYGQYLFDEDVLASDVRQAAITPTSPDQSSPDDSGPVPGGAEKTWRTLQTLRVKLARRQEAAAHLVAHPGTALNDWAESVAGHERHLVRAQEMLNLTRAELQATAQRRALAQAQGAKIPGTRPVPVEEHIRIRRLKAAYEATSARLDKVRAARPTTTKINTTDPGSRIMPGKHDGFDQRHNVQALACKNQFIIAIATHDSSNDKQALQGLLHTARANLDAAAIHDPIKVALFDSGYASEANFSAALPVDTLLIAVAKEHRQTAAGPTPTPTAQAWHVMADRLAEPVNHDLYKRRSAIIEPLFAQLFTRFGRNLTLRGQDVTTELHLWAVTHNLLKISRHHRTTRPPG